MKLKCSVNWNFCLLKYFLVFSFLAFIAAEWVEWIRKLRTVTGSSNNLSKASASSKCKIRLRKKIFRREQFLSLRARPMIYEAYFWILFVFFFVVVVLLKNSTSYGLVRENDTTRCRVVEINERKPNCKLLYTKLLLKTSTTLSFFLNFFKNNVILKTVKLVLIFLFYVKLITRSFSLNIS